MFATYQMNFNISPTRFENFIEIKQVWPQLQPPRPLEVKLKIYTQSRYGFSWSYSSVSKFCHQNYWILKSYSCPKTFSSLTSAFFKNPWGYLNNFWEWNNAFFNFVSHETKSMILCKFWVWPPSVFEAVAEAILGWPQWIFQNLWIR